jgi:rod shape-determining protein MreD
MWPTLVSIPLLGLALMVQTAIISRLNLLSGSADLVLLILAAWSLQEQVKRAWVWGLVGGLMVGFVSGVSWYVYLASYLTIVGVARLLTRRVWQAPLLAMFAVTLIGTLVLQMSTYLVLTLSQVQLPLADSFAKIVLPSVLLNLILAIPVHALVRDLARRIYPTEEVQ